MKRISLFMAAPIACLLFAAVGNATAMPTEGIVILLQSPLDRCGPHESPRW